MKDLEWVLRLELGCHKMRLLYSTIYQTNKNYCSISKTNYWLLSFVHSNQNSNLQLRPFNAHWHLNSNLEHNWSVLVDSSNWVKSTCKNTPHSISNSPTLFILDQFDLGMLGSPFIKILSLSAPCLISRWHSFSLTLTLSSRGCLKHNHPDCPHLRYLSHPLCALACDLVAYAHINYDIHHQHTTPSLWQHSAQSPWLVITLLLLLHVNPGLYKYSHLSTMPHITPLWSQANLIFQTSIPGCTLPFFYFFFYSFPSWVICKMTSSWLACAATVHAKPHTTCMYCTRPYHHHQSVWVAAKVQIPNGILA